MTFASSSPLTPGMSLWRVNGARPETLLRWDLRPSSRETGQRLPLHHRGKLLGTAHKANLQHG
jgi:hypothetical protein